MSEQAAWGMVFAILGLICGAVAAYLHGGLIEALAAASGGFSALASVLGYAAKTATPKT